MDRRKKENEGIVEGLSTLLIFAIFFWVLDQTKSLAISGVAALIVFVFVLLILYIRRMLYEEKLRRSGIKEIDKMDGRQFEKYLGLLFKSYGYSVIVTKSSGDYGADLVISKNGKKIVVQAKRYSKSVGIKAVQEAQASIAYYNAHEAWVVSNSSYTDAACVLAKSNQVRLIDRGELISLIIKLKDRKSKKQNPKACP